ncbi:MAG: NAD-dependent deacylase [Desulfohalobiaceae bacterium]|nr:NAD-dependent deacylase [Desulfohalobiaceae bacterium]
MPDPEQERINQAAHLFKKSKFAVAFTGAGISVPSGIPDFRSPGGLWSKYDPLLVASAQALDNNPEQVWNFLLETSSLLDKAKPNPAHLSLAELEKQGRLQGVITQNIDNLHQKGGSRVVVEYHGNFQRFYCRECYREVPLSDIRQAEPSSVPLLCRECKGLVRPDVVFFGESIPQSAHARSLNLVQAADLILIAGTSGEVAPANTLPDKVKRNQGRIIEINLGRTAYTQISDIRFDGPVEEVLPKLADMILT